MRNNLVNIRNTAPVYRGVTYRILKELPDDVLVVIANVKQIAVIGTDNYFLHYSVFPIIDNEPNDDRVLEKVRVMMKKYVETDDYRRIKPVTELDDDLSMIYAIKLTEAFVRELEKKIKERGGGIRNQIGNREQIIKTIIDATCAGSNRNRGGRGGDQGSQGTQGQSSQQASNGGGSSVSIGLSDLGALGVSENDIHNIVSNAMKKARKAVEVARDIKSIFSNTYKKGKGGGVGGLSAGSEPGGFEKLLNLVNQVLQVRDADKIVSNAKRIDDFAFYVKIRKVRDRFGDELGGYRVTRKVEDAIARELALPDDLFYAKLVGGPLIAKEKLRYSEGAYYVLIDKSGSMSGEKTIWARSVALALFKVAMKKKREYFLRFFDVKVSKLASDPTEVMELILTIGSGGGTSITRALKTAIKDLRGHRRLKGKTNTIVIITDGEDRIAYDALLEGLRSVNARLVAVMIWGRNKDLKRLAEATGGQCLKVEMTEDGALRVIEVSE